MIRSRIILLVVLFVISQVRQPSPDRSGISIGTVETKNDAAEGNMADTATRIIEPVVATESATLTEVREKELVSLYLPKQRLCHAENRQRRRASITISCIRFTFRFLSSSPFTLTDISRFRHDNRCRSIIARGETFPCAKLKAFKGCGLDARGG